MKATRIDPALWNRFWAKVEKTDTCWIWTAARNGHGYGNFRLPGRNRGAHRVAYMWLVGPIEDLLRGEGHAGKRARQTHCVHGHEFTPENTNIKRNGCRECRACSSRRSSEKWQRRKAAAKEAK